MVLVVGSTGELGSRITKRLAKAGRPVTALVRSASSDKAKALQAAGAKTVVGDIKNPKDVANAMQGIETVIATASSTLSRQEGDSIETVDLRGIQTVIDEAEKSKVKNFIFVSAYFTNDSPLAQAKWAAEKKLSGGRMNYTIIVPSYFPETWFSPLVGFDVPSGSVRIYGNGKAGVNYIAVDDVADAVVACLGNAKASRRTIRIGGPKPLSQLEAVALWEKAKGRKILVEHMPTEVIQNARAGEKDPMTQSFLALFEILAQGDDIDPSWSAQLGVTPKSMEQWIAEHSRP
jgi:uncharacterized protein YbjT (DUF2867 family)